MTHDELYMTIPVEEFDELGKKLKMLVEAVKFAISDADQTYFGVQEPEYVKKLREALKGIS